MRTFGLPNLDPKKMDNAAISFGNDYKPFHAFSFLPFFKTLAFGLTFRVHFFKIQFNFFL